MSVSVDDGAATEVGAGAFTPENTDSRVAAHPLDPTITVFSMSGIYGSLGSQTLLESLQGGGGGGTTGAARILLRAGTSTYLNARHDGIDYPLSASDVIISVDVALSGGSRDAMLALAASLDANNNLGCPLN